MIEGPLSLQNFNLRDERDFQATDTDITIITVLAVIGFFLFLPLGIVLHH